MKRVIQYFLIGVGVMVALVGVILMFDEPAKITVQKAPKKAAGDEHISDAEVVNDTVVE